MTPSPLVSIIIPTYRRWHLLCEAIDSVFRQSYTNWEAIVVNDDPGSAPKGRIQELLQDRRVRLINHDRNQGHSAARNTGIANSSGDYLAYLDDDDLFYPDHIQTLLDVMVKNSCQVAYSDAYEGRYEAASSDNRLICRNRVYCGPFEKQKMLQANTIPILTVLHHRCCLDKTGLFDTSLPVLEDWDFWLRLLINYDFHFVDAVTAEYRIWKCKENLSQKTSEERWNNTQLQIYRKVLNMPELKYNKNLRNIFQKAVYRWVRERSEWVLEQLKRSDREPAINDVLRHIRYQDRLGLLYKKPMQALQMALRKP